MICARLADIEVFATGRHRRRPPRRRAALRHLRRPPRASPRPPSPRSPPAPRAILDLPKTLELLETLACPVIRRGQDELPAFWSGLGYSGPTYAWTARADRRAHPRCVAPWASPGASSSANPFPKLTRSAAEVLAPQHRPGASVRPRKAVIAPRPSPPFFVRIFDLTEGSEPRGLHRAVCSKRELLAARVAAELGRRPQLRERRGGLVVATAGPLSLEPPATPPEGPAHAPPLADTQAAPLARDAHPRGIAQQLLRRRGGDRANRPHDLADLDLRGLGGRGRDALRAGLLAPPNPS
jgi:hypothetical protein